jgi:hypothetical protein
MFSTSSLTILAIVVFATIVLNVVERYTRQKPIETADALKLGTLSAALTGGVLYAVGDTEVISAAVETAQDMFVGKPSF